MPLKRSHTLYLQSKHRDSGTNSNYVISLPELIRSDANEDNFKISLQNFTTYNNWFLVKDGADTITIDAVPVTIPHGHYPYQRLARVLEAYTGASVHWSQESNIMRFVFDTSKTVNFDGLGKILGFEPNTSYTGTTIISPTSMMPYENPHIMIHLNNVAPVEEHLCMSNHSGEVRMANILAKVLINASPFQLIEHQQVLETQGIFTADNSLGALEIFITDKNGQIFTDMPDHEMVLTIESVDIDYYDMKKVIDELKDIREAVKNLLVLKVLGRK
jgi:hypothetical protein